MVADDSSALGSPNAPGAENFANIRRLMDANDDLSLTPLRDALEATRPGARWSDDADGVR